MSDFTRGERKVGVPICIPCKTFHQDGRLCFTDGDVFISGLSSARRITGDKSCCKKIVPAENLRCLPSECSPFCSSEFEEIYGKRKWSLLSSGRNEGVFTAASGNIKLVEEIVILKLQLNRKLAVVLMHIEEAKVITKNSMDFIEMRLNIMYLSNHQHPRERMVYHHNDPVEVMRRRYPVNVIRLHPTDDSWELNLSGFRYIFNAQLSGWERIMWFHLCLAILSVCVYQIYDRTTAFMEYPVTTKTDFVTNKTIRFPAVAICADVDIQNERILQEYFYKLKKYTYYADIDNELKTGKITVYDIWNIPRTDILNVTATIQDGSSRKNQIITELFRTSETYTPLGMCLDLIPSQELEFQESQLSVNLAVTAAGFRQTVKVMLHNDGRLPSDQYRMLHVSKDLSNAYLYGYILHITQIIKVNTRKDPCVDEATASNCLSACIQRNIKHSTNDFCSLPFMSLSEEKPCTSLKEISHVMANIFDITNKIHLPDCGCPKVCDEMIYKIERELNNGRKVNNDYNVPHTIEIRIFENVILVMKDERSYTWLNLCCDIGGGIGLWLGICLIEVLEEISSTFSRLLYRIANKHKLKPVTPKRLTAEIQVIRRKHFDTEKVADENIGIPGFQNSINGNLPLCTRILWLLISSISLSLCIYQCVMLLVKYADDSSLTTTYYEDSKNGSSYPLLTICPETEEDFLPVVNPYLYRLEFNEPASYKNIQRKLEDGTLHINHLWNLSQFNIERISYSLFAASRYVASSNYAKFVEVNTVLGRCISLITEDYVLRKLRGSHLKVMIVGNNSETNHKRVILHDAAERIMLPYFSKENGYKIPIQHQYPSMYPELHFIFSKIIRRNIFKKKCSTRLNVAKCLTRCMERKIFARAAKPCRLPFIQNTAEFPLCSSYKDYVLMNNATLVTLGEFKTEECNCPVNCEEINLKMSNYDYNYLPDQKSISIYLSIMHDRHIVVEEYKAYTFFALVSDMGGAMGLLLGFCTFQLIDIFAKLISKFIKVLKRCFWQEKSSVSPYQRGPAILYERTIVLFTRNDKNQAKEMSGMRIPGFEHVFRKTSSKWVRLVWLVISVSAICTCIFQCSERISYFLTDPSDVITYYQYKSSFPYPVLMIGKCKDIMYYYSSLRRENPNASFPDLWSTQIAVNDYVLYVNGVKNPTLPKTVNTCMGSGFAGIISKPIQYNGVHTNLTAEVEFNKANIGLFYCLTVLTPTEESLLLAYDVTYHPSRFPDYQPISMSVARILVERRLRVMELNYRNTRQNPCTDGEVVANCLVECMEKRIFASVNSSCRMPFMQPHPLISECKTNEELFRMQDATLSELREFNFDDPTTCYCPRRCKHRWYTIEKQSQTFPYDSRVTEIRMQIAVSIPDNNIFITQEEEAYPFLKLLSDVGGTLGLYIGFGALQMLEIVERIVKKVVL